jgi:hypothetical protein
MRLFAIMSTPRMYRRCFLPPLPEHHRAADLLLHAADALLDGNLRQAEALVLEADFQALEDYRLAIAGPINPAIIRQAKPPAIPRLPRKGRPRMPTGAIEKQVLARDGYRCRFCDTRVIVKEAQKAFTAAFPNAARWGSGNKNCHFGLAVLRASIDHLIPFQRGGDNCICNLVTTCNPCQFGRGYFLLDEVELEDPRKRLPIVDSWDGLTRLRGLRITRE